MQYMLWQNLHPQTRQSVKDIPLSCAITHNMLSLILLFACLYVWLHGWSFFPVTIAPAWWNGTLSLCTSGCWLSRLSSYWSHLVVRLKLLGNQVKLESHGWLTTYLLSFRWTESQIRRRLNWCLWLQFLEYCLIMIRVVNEHRVARVGLGTTPNHI